MDLTSIIKDGSIIESLENYAIADQLAGSEEVTDEPQDRGKIFSDYNFWRGVTRTPEDYWNRAFQFDHFAFSDWVPRIPGLGFTSSAKIISHQLRNAVPLTFDRRIYRPSDKSGFVMSGVGSLKLPPDYDGYRLTCITSSRSCSRGIPLLISPEVDSYHRLKNGDRLESVQGIWQKMTTDWVKHFAVTEQLPRGYIVVKHPDQLKKAGSLSEFYCDPCSIMEYEQDDILKWDYVFCNVPTSEKKQKQEIQAFFKNYQQTNGFHGKYLINPDVGEPLFDTVYHTPADLKTDYAQAQLALMKERMNKTAVESLNIDQLTAKIAASYNDPYSLRVFARKCGINAGLVAEDAPVKMAVQIVYLAITNNLLLELTQRLLIEQTNHYDLE